MSEIVGQRMSEYQDADSIQDADKKAYYKEHAKITTFGKLSGTDTSFSNYNMDLSDISGEISGDIASNIADGNTITASNGKLSANVPVTDVTVDGSSVVSGGVAVIPKQVNADWDADGSSSIAKILNKPDLSVYAVTDNLAAVATSGEYTDLSGTPSLATVATSGSYNDLTDQPTIPDPQVNADWTSSSGVAVILHKPNLSIYAETSSLAPVATSGSYEDLDDKPTIPDPQVNVDWDSSSGVAKILNKPDLSVYAQTSSLAPVATSGSYTDLEDKPTIPSIPPFPEDAGSIDYVLGIKDNKLAWVVLDSISSS